MLNARKQASRGVVADAVIDRPKGYFPVPALKCIRGAFLDFVRTVLEAPRARQRGLFNRAYVDGLLANNRLLGFGSGASVVSITRHSLVRRGIAFCYMDAQPLLLGLWARAS